MYQLTKSTYSSIEINAGRHGTETCGQNTKTKLSRKRHGKWREWKPFLISDRNVCQITSLALESRLFIVQSIKTLPNVLNFSEKSYVLNLL